MAVSKKPVMMEERSAKCYYVDTVGKNESRIAEYIENQLKEGELGEQLVIPGTSPFTGRK